MDILFADTELERLCSNARLQQKKLGRSGARKLQRRLADLLAAQNLGEIVAGRPHPLSGDRAGQFAVSLDGGRRLVFEPADEAIPLTQDDAIAWTLVRTIRIVFIGDYHG